MRGKRNTLILFLCMAIFFSSNFYVSAEIMTASSVQIEKAELEQQLREIERMIGQYEQELVGIKGEKKTLQNRIRQIQKEQSILNARMKATTLTIREVLDELTQTNDRITQSEEKIDQLKVEIAENLRLIRENDDRSLLYVFFSEHTLFDALTQMQGYTQLSDGLVSLLEKVNQKQDELEKERIQLEEEEEYMSQLLSIQELQRNQLSGSYNEQSKLLTQTKGKEKNFQIALSETEKQAAQIRTRLYELLDVGKRITFGEAVEIANWVSAQTGVRAAFVLAVLTQESNLGKNVGTCNRAGDPPNKSWKVIMKPSRDHEPFLTITSELGLDPDTTAVSCPMRDKRGNQIGWGGAMGPAQFIPSTWMGYRAKVTAITGKSANPWDIRDAFLASAIKLGNDGARIKEGEWAAAMKYFSGSTNTRFRFYGDQVVAIAEKYQGEIEQIEK